IITPLKDRIQSQILTHYPPTIELGMKITAQEVRTPKEQATRVLVPDLVRVLIERIAMEARDSEYVDRRSGVSARLTISALESVISAAERRALRNGEARTSVRIGDLQAVVPAITGKIELVYEGEQEGPEHVAKHLLSVSVRNVFKGLFPEAVKARRQGKSAAQRPANDPFAELISWFDSQELDLMADATEKEHVAALLAMPGLKERVTKDHPYLQAAELPLWMEFVLHGLAEHSRIGRNALVGSVRFGDVLGSMMSGDTSAEEEG
ncbi:MAG TPA: magnesium chelatase, partial [Flavobacteriales bacterium]|nr:magnesium chelatase [Flavobacteriales bacterium]